MTDAAAATEPRTRRRVLPVLAVVFGPRPIESALFGALIGFVGGIPLVWSIFFSHAIAIFFFGSHVLTTELETPAGLNEPWVALSVALVASIVIVLEATPIVLLAVFRKNSAPTMLLSAFFAGLVPYLLFFQLFVRDMV